MKPCDGLLWSIPFSRHPYTIYKCESSVIADIWLLTFCIDVSDDTCQIPHACKEIWVSTCRYKTPGLQIHLKSLLQEKKWKLHCCQISFVFLQGTSDTQGQHFPKGPRGEPSVFRNWRVRRMGIVWLLIHSFCFAPPLVYILNII